MALINCPECGTEVSDKAEVCPKCSYPFSQTNIKSSNTNNSTATEVKQANGVWKIIRNGTLLLLVIVGLVWVSSLFINSGGPGNYSPIKVVVNPPKPRLVESHAAEDPSSEMLAFREGVYATVLNEGGSGRVLVKATLQQGSNIYKRSEDVYLGENQTQEVHFVFTEPARLGADMKYDVSVIAMQ